MSDTTTREERRSRLDEFAQAQVPQSAGELVPVQPAAPLAMFAPLPPVGERDERKVLQKIRSLAAAAGDDWYYRYPVKNRRKGTTEWIEGPSIKLANDIARLYGNCDVDVRYLDLGNVYSFYARFVDRESGFSLTRPFQQNKSAAKIGGEDDARRNDMALQIGTSKAERNVVVNALQTFASFAFKEAREALVDQIEGDPEKWRERASERIQNLVSLDRVEAVVGRPVKDWLAQDIARVIAMGKAVNDGMATVDETFPPLRQAEPDERRMVDDKLDRFVTDEKSEPGLTGPGPDQAAASPPPSVPPEAAATPPEEDDWDTLKLIDRTLGMATVGNEDVEQRLANLDAQTVWLDEHYPEKIEFIGTLHSMAAKVARGDLAKEAARRYLQALGK